MMTARGQALIELAIMGSFLIMLLGLLLGYGLNYDYQQQATMTAFRQGLQIAAKSTADNTPTSTTNILIQDRHVPNPGHPFGVGGVSPATSFAAVTRNYRLQDVPERDSELPRIAIQVRGVDRCPNGAAPDASTNPPSCYYKLADFRSDINVQWASRERYQFIYGASNVCDKFECGGGFESCPDGIYYDEPNPLDPQGENVMVCANPARTLRIIDSCEGEIMSYDDCVRQATQIADAGACREACLKAGKTTSECQKICDLPINDVPWYAAGASCSGGRCTAPVIDGLFRGVRAMGMQPGIVQVRRMNGLTLTRSETAGGVTTSDGGSWEDETTRMMMTVTGPPGGAKTRSEQPMTTVTGQSMEGGGL